MTPCDCEFTNYQKLTSRAVGKLRRAELMEYITSLEQCLSHVQGTKYLEMFTQQQFCVELYQFLTKYREFKCEALKGNLPAMQRIGNELMRDFIRTGSAQEVNISYTCRDALYQQLQRRRQRQIEQEQEQKQKQEQEEQKNRDMAGDNSGDVLFTSEVFDKAHVEVKQLLRRNVWAKFQMCMVELCGAQDMFEQWKKKQKMKYALKRSVTARTVSFDRRLDTDNVHSRMVCMMCMMCSADTVLSYVYVGLSV